MAKAPRTNTGNTPHAALMVTWGVLSDNAPA